MSYVKAPNLSTQNVFGTPDVNVQGGQVTLDASENLSLIHI